MTTSTRATSLLGSLIGGFGALWTKWRSSFVLALRSLWLHKLRSMLSVLGIIIGTSAVIALIAFGKGTTNVIVRSVKPMDETTSQRRSWVANYGLTWEAYDRCKMLETVIGDVPM